MVAARLTMRLSPSPRRIGRALGELGKDLGDFKPVFRDLLPQMVRGIVVNFERQGSPLGEKWQDLSPQWKSRKATSGLSGRILVARGGMLDNLRSSSKMKRSLTKTRLVVGPYDSLPYIHHFGSQKAGLPARRFIAWSSTMRNIALRSMEDFVARQVADAAGRIRGAGGVL